MILLKRSGLELRTENVGETVDVEHALEQSTNDDDDERYTF